MHFRENEHTNEKKPVFVFLSKRKNAIRRFYSKYEFYEIA